MLPFLPVNMTELETECKLPPIEPNAEWRRKTDLPPWRRTSPTRKQVQLKSLAGHTNSSARLENKDKVQPKLKKHKGSASISADSSSSAGSNSNSGGDESPASRKTQNEDMDTDL